MVKLHNMEGGTPDVSTPKLCPTIWTTLFILSRFPPKISGHLKSRHATHSPRQVPVHSMKISLSNLFFSQTRKNKNGSYNPEQVQHPATLNISIVRMRTCASTYYMCAKTNRYIFQKVTTAATQLQNRNVNRYELYNIHILYTYPCYIVLHNVTYALHMSARVSPVRKKQPALSLMILFVHHQIHLRFSKQNERQYNEGN